MSETASAELQRVVDRLAEFYTPAEIRRWLDTRHSLLGNERAIDLINAGRAKEVLAVVQILDAGSYT